MPFAAHVTRSAIIGAGIAVLGICMPHVALADDVSQADDPAAKGQQSGGGGAEAFAKLFRRWKSSGHKVASAPSGAAGRTHQSLAATHGSDDRHGSGRLPLTSTFGMRKHPLLGGWRPHLGVDLAARMGAPVFATADGIVSMAGARGGYGIMVALDHGSGMQTRYGHLSRLNVTLGQRVRKGDVIGFVGSTGLSTGPHLHYETRVNGRAVDPLPYIRR